MYDVNRTRIHDSVLLRQYIINGKLPDHKVDDRNFQFKI